MLPCGVEEEEEEVVVVELVLPVVDVVLAQGLGNGSVFSRPACPEPDSVK